MKALKTLVRTPLQLLGATIIVSIMGLALLGAWFRDFLDDRS